MPTIAKGFFEHDIVRAYLTDFMDHPDDVYEKPDVEYRYDPVVLDNLHQASGVVCSDGKAKLALADIGHCLYMDVGCWAGNGPKDARNHARHREFGVVCGNVAALCEFPGIGPKPQKTADTRPVEKSEKSLTEGDNLFAKRIVPLLDYLSAKPILGDEPDKLGHVRVVSALSAVDGSCPDLDEDTLYVFLGDLHLPAMTELERTYVRNEVVPGAGGGILRAGRLDLSQDVKNLIGYLLAASGLGVTVPGLAIPTAVAGLSFGTLARWLWTRESLNMPRALEDDGEMTRDEAREWFFTYNGTSASKGADIFQNAAEDLLTFLRLLRDRPSHIGRVELVQLGDLNDLWIGMKCGFGPYLSPKPGTSFFVDFWRDQVKKSGRVGKVVAALEELQNDPHLPTTLLYGNHDNYLSKSRPASKTDKGNTFWAEHGHQSDSFNCDDDAVNGWALTQAAFLVPAVRDLEDPASAAICASKRTLSDEAYPARLERLARGADVCLENNKLIYVMGHTHRACLRRISIRAECDLAKWRQHWYSGVLREAKRIYNFVDDMNALRDKVERDSQKTATDAAGSQAEILLRQATRRLAKATKDVESAKRVARSTATAELAKGRAELDAAEREVAEWAVKAAKAGVVAEKAGTAACKVAKGIAEEQARAMADGIADEAVVAARIGAAATQAAGVALDTYLGLLRRELDAAKALGRKSYKGLRRAAQWLSELPSSVANDLEQKAEEIYRGFVQSLGSPPGM
jgi:UDP-2,3-diacylglucosamine pyrophosphatase LpxH